MITTWPDLNVDQPAGDLVTEGDTAYLRVAAQHPAVDGEISAHDHVYHHACGRLVPILMWVYGSHPCPADQ